MPNSTEPLIAGQVPLHEIMARLACERPVFHSEADLRLAFVRALWTLAPEIAPRLEVGQHQTGPVELLDLLCLGPLGTTAVEFKYFTARWTGTVADHGEQFALRAHSSDDVARQRYVSDIERLERFCAPAHSRNGLALIVTNAATLWSPPLVRMQPTRDAEFRIHHGRSLSGTLLWGGGDYRANTRVLHGRYELHWRPYAQLKGRNGELRYLVVEVTSGPAPQDP
ncbi:hypothetical protein ACFU8W_38645 [Streptomyces sp. NPDC057565]|uniref:hypothetical protein n=1 Tax=Streptomyces sp. NPDC057565 TaxID=3346169 RepID=UPI00369E2BE8